MKKNLFLTSFFLAYAMVCNAQEIELSGIVNTSQTGSKITLNGPGVILNKGVTLTAKVIIINSGPVPAGGTALELNGAKIKCDVLTIQPLVTALKITGETEITCSTYLINNTIASIQIVNSTQTGSLTLNMPDDSPIISFINNSAATLKIQRNEKKPK